MVSAVRIIIIIIAGILIGARSLFAYDFIYIGNDGRPITWDNTKSIQYYLDPGKLGYLTSEQAHALLQEAMKILENVSTAKVPHFEFAGFLPEDVNKDNYSKYVDKTACYTDRLDTCDVEARRNLQTVIIFDDERWITENVMCRISGGCAGVVAPPTFSGSLSYSEFMVQGAIVFEPSPFNTNGTVALFIHELGHLLGLNHTSLNQQLFYANDLEADEKLFMPTMEVSASGRVTGSASSEGTTLNSDDIAGISTLYPLDSSSAQMSQIMGKIVKSDGSPLQYVNVIARNIVDPLCSAYSVVTGRLCDYSSVDMILTCLENKGNYTIESLPPGNYTVEVEELDWDQNMNTALNELPGDAEFWNEGDQAAEDPYTYTVISLAAGEVRENVDIILNRSEVTEDRVKFIPLDVILGYFPMPAVTACTDTTVDYAALIGIDEGGNDDASAGGGCSLIVRNKVNRKH